MGKEGCCGWSCRAFDPQEPATPLSEILSRSHLPFPVFCRPSRENQWQRDSSSEQYQENRYLTATTTATATATTVLALFRNNQFTTAILLAFYVALTHLSALLEMVHPSPGEDLEGGVLYLAWFSWADEHALWSAVAAAVLVFIQALAVNILADEFRLLDDRSWLPGLFYVLMTACMPGFLFLSPPLVATTFIPMVLRRIFKAYNQPKATALVFDAAFWTTVASLFYPPAIFLLIAVYFSFGIMRAYSFRERVVSLVGVLTTLFLAWLWYFWKDMGWDFWHIQFGGLFGIYRFGDFESSDFVMLQKAGLLAILFLIVILSYGMYMSRKLIQTQKCVSVLYWFFFVGALSILLRENPNPAHFILIMPAIGIFLAMSFSSFRSAAMAELFHLALLGFILFIQFSGQIEGFTRLINPS